MEKNRNKQRQPIAQRVYDLAVACKGSEEDSLALEQGMKAMGRLAKVQVEVTGKSAEAYGSMDGVDRSIALSTLKFYKDTTLEYTIAQTNLVNRLSKIYNVPAVFAAKDGRTEFDMYSKSDKDLVTEFCKDAVDQAFEDKTGQTFNLENFVNKQTALMEKYAVGKDENGVLIVNENAMMADEEYRQAEPLKSGYELVRQELEDRRAVMLTPIQKKIYDIAKACKENEEALKRLEIGIEGLGKYVETVTNAATERDINDAQREGSDWRMEADSINATVERVQASTIDRVNQLNRLADEFNVDHIIEPINHENEFDVNSELAKQTIDAFCHDVVEQAFDDKSGHEFSLDKFIEDIEKPEDR